MTNYEGVRVMCFLQFFFPPPLQLSSDISFPHILSPPEIYGKVHKEKQKN